MAFIFNSILTEIAIFVVTCIFGLYMYFTRNFKYWQKRGVHYMKPTPLVGNIGRVLLQKEDLNQYIKNVYDTNAGHPVIGYFAMQTPLLIIRSLDMVRNVMVKDAAYFLDRSLSGEPPEKNASIFSRSLFALAGKRWRHLRVKLTPTFTSGKIKNMFYLINECGKELASCIEDEMKTKKSVQAKEVVARYSTDVIASCAFGVNANALADPNCEFRSTMRMVFEPKGLEKLIRLLGPIVPWLTRFIKRDETVPNYVRKTFWDVVEHRKKNGIVRKDFVDILMQIKEEGAVRVVDTKELDEIKQDSKYIQAADAKTENVDIKLVDDDFVGQAFIFILAGFETSSSVVAYTLHELALNSEIQDRLRREIQEVLDKHNSEVTYEAIAEMTYLEMVVSETLRKHPTLPLLDRRCVQDYRIPGSNLVIEKGTVVIIPVEAIHWDPSIYPQPEKFDPERFTPENKSKRPAFTYMPFGEGPRICIGMRFGQMQVKTALVHILNSFKIKPSSHISSSPAKTGRRIDMKDIVLTFHKIK